MFLLINGAAAIASVSANFNTSHVSINLNQKINNIRPMDYFNTSHVSINLCRKTNGWSTASISIHPMFLLIFSR